jgi:hypothetical protein
LLSTGKSIAPFASLVTCPTLLGNRRGLGANGNDVTFTSPVGKYAEYDGPSPLVKALGQDGVAKLVAKIGPMAAVFETIVRTRVPDLSF